MSRLSNLHAYPQSGAEEKADLAYAIWHDPTLRTFEMGDLGGDDLWQPCLDIDCPYWSKDHGKWVAHWHAGRTA